MDALSTRAQSARTRNGACHPDCPIDASTLICSRPHDAGQTAQSCRQLERAAHARVRLVAFRRDSADRGCRGRAGGDGRR